MRLEINYNIKFSDNMHKLEGQEMNVKSYAGEKISQIIK